MVHEQIVPQLVGGGGFVVFVRDYGKELLAESLVEVRRSAREVAMAAVAGDVYDSVFGVGVQEILAVGVFGEAGG